MDKYKVGFGIAAVMTVGLALYTWANREETTKLKETLVEKEVLISTLSSKYKEQLLVNKNLKTRTTTVITKPDGTKITQDTTTEDRSEISKDVAISQTKQDSTSKITSQTSEKTTQVKPSMTKYSLFVNTQEFSSYRTVHLGLGMRLATTPLWLQAEGGVDRTIRAGLRVDF